MICLTRHGHINLPHHKNLSITSFHGVQDPQSWSPPNPLVSSTAPPHLTLNQLQWPYCFSCMLCLLPLRALIFWGSLCLEHTPPSHLLILLLLSDCCSSVTFPEHSLDSLIQGTHTLIPPLTPVTSTLYSPFFFPPAF